MKTDALRQAYLDFFIERGHTLVPSAPLVPHDDPTLLFTSAGMVPFKNYYSGVVDPLPFRRAVSCQKCFRAGGKASDLENVGKTLRHHTFFEMLGNFSFGDYFKREACAWALEFSRDVAKLDMNRVWVTYHEKDPETRDIWVKDLGFPAERVLPLGDKDNWWGPAGETGACGPCSEMHYDRGPEHGTGPQDHIGGSTDRYLEYWNMVFPQFDHQKDGSRPILKNRGIDTGLGLSRLTAILQNASLYTIDSMWPITQACASAMGVGDYMQADAKTKLAVNAVADHVRALTFLISEGHTIGNTDRGYVLKRVLRRAARMARAVGMEQPFIHKLVGIVVDSFGHIYPEIKARPDFVSRVIEADERQFHQTMGRGLKMVEDELETLRNSNATTFPGELAFHLWQQEGIPFEDVQEIAGDNGMTVDLEGYKKAEGIHVSRSKGAGAFANVDQAAFHTMLLEKHGTTRFLGYETMETAGTVLALSHNGQSVDRIEAGQSPVEVILDETSFYAESGGQVGDKGTLIGVSGRFAVADTKKTPGGLIRHLGTLTDGSLSVGDVVKAVVNASTRQATQRNHSATHLMQGALKRVLGSHVTQRGSLVNDTGLRFDFTHLEAMTLEQMRQIEELVNAQILHNGTVDIQVLPVAEANAVPGVIAPFDEKYGNNVRVVSMGKTVAGDADELTYWDVEFCGGTHVARTGDIGVFVLKSESSIAQGTRRVEGLTGDAALAYFGMTRDIYRSLASTLSVDGGRVTATVEALMKEKRALEDEVVKLKRELAVSGVSELLAKAEAVGETKVVRHAFDALSPDEMRAVSIELAKKLGDKSVIVLGSKAGGKATLMAAVSPALQKQVSAGNLIKEIAAHVGGKGGGRPDFAQAGGKDVDGLQKALDAVSALVK